MKQNEQVVKAYDRDGVPVVADSPEAIARERHWPQHKVTKYFVLRCRRGTQIGQLYDPDATFDDERRRIRAGEEDPDYTFVELTELQWTYYMRYLTGRSRVDYRMANRDN